MFAGSALTADPASAPLPSPSYPPSDAIVATPLAPSAAAPAMLTTSQAHLPSCRQCGPRQPWGCDPREVADRVIFMDEGQILEQGHPEHFFTSPTHERTKLFLSRILRA